MKEIQLYLLTLLRPDGTITSFTERGESQAEALASYYAEEFGVSVTIEYVV